MSTQTATEIVVKSATITAPATASYHAGTSLRTNSTTWLIDIESQMLSHVYRQTNWYNLPHFMGNEALTELHNMSDLWVVVDSLNTLPR